jgi:hypothetical protein
LQGDGKAHISSLAGQVGKLQVKTGDRVYGSGVDELRFHFWGFAN